MQHGYCKIEKKAVTLQREKVWLMLEAFKKTHDYLVEHVHVPIRRMLMDEIDWNDRLIAIKGGRGAGKTDFLLNYVKETREKDPELAKHMLYINLNDFYFTEHSIVEFAGEFVREGGKVLLIDQAFKYPDWSRELATCFYQYPKLRIVFAASPVMRLIEDNRDIGASVHLYNLRGFSFREYLNVTLGLNLCAHTLEDILQNHVEIAQEVCKQVHPIEHFGNYLHHGYYPLFLEPHDFSESLLKMMNMVLEVDVLLIKQIDVGSLSKLRKLLYIMLQETPCPLNITNLSQAIDCSRSTTMNYIKYLKDARLLNLLYQEDRQYPLKPRKVYMQNTNLCYAISTREPDAKTLAETFFYTSLHGNHKINATDRSAMFIIDGKYYMDAYASAPEKSGIRHCAIADIETGEGKNIPMWMFGFLY